MHEKYAILVTVKVKPGTADRFRPHILKNAAAALRDEPDCHQFQVLVDDSDPETFVFYEVYSDEASLAAHRETPHFKAYMEAAGDLIAERTARPCRLLTS